MSGCCPRSSVTCLADVQRLSHKLEIEPELLKKYFRINIKMMCGGGLVSDQPIS